MSTKMRTFDCVCLTTVINVRTEIDLIGIDIIESILFNQTSLIGLNFRYTVEREIFRLDIKRRAWFETFSLFFELDINRSSDSNRFKSDHHHHHHHHRGRDRDRRVDKNARRFKLLYGRT